VRAAALLIGASLAIGCSETKPAPASASNEHAPHGTAAPQPSAESSAGAGAAVGKPAPDFKLKDTAGNDVSLSQHKGKIVVLEWFNPECPFVKRSHTKGSLKGLAPAMMDKGVVWLAINSGAPGKQGAGAEKSKAGAEALGVKNPILLDESGDVGKLYGATNTPHLFVVDPEGVLVYAGAIDNSPDAEGESPEGGKLVNYVAEAVAAISEKRPVATPKTTAYGCSVKY
jgi:peroxiredoxin